MTGVWVWVSRKFESNLAKIKKFRILTVPGNRDKLGSKRYTPTLLTPNFSGSNVTPVDPDPGERGSDFGRDRTRFRGLPP